MENVSHVLHENKGAQSSVRAKSSCITLEQVEEVTIADLRLDFYVMMKKAHNFPCFGFPHYGNMYMFPLMKHFEMDVK